VTGDAITKAQDLVYNGWEAMGTSLGEAKKFSEEALKLPPNLADAYNGLASIALKKEKLRSAEDYYRKAYESAARFRPRPIGNREFRWGNKRI
jgi:tetratricopeptide (TPR) repeat protein